MDTKNFHIHRGNAEQMAELLDTDTEDIEKRMVAMTEGEVNQIQDAEKKAGTGINYRNRKGYMRNKPCPCGSGRKFKKCHWSQYRQYLNEKRGKV